MKIGSKEHKEMAFQNFEKIFSEMTELMRKARSFEFFLKIAKDIEDHSEKFLSSDYRGYSASEFVADSPKPKRALRDRFKTNAQYELLEKVHAFAEPLAHADYWSARKKIDVYVEMIDIPTSLNENAYPERAVDNIQGPDGQKYSYARLITSSPQNMVIEEFQVFRHQGYVSVAEVALQKATDKIAGKRMLAWKWETTSIARAMRERHRV